MAISDHDSSDLLKNFKPVQKSPRSVKAEKETAEDNEKQDGKNSVPLDKSPTPTRKRLHRMRNQSSKMKSDKDDRSPISGIVIKKLKKDEKSQQSKTVSETGETTPQLSGDIDTK